MAVMARGKFYIGTAVLAALGACGGSEKQPGAPKSGSEASVLSSAPTAVEPETVASRVFPADWIGTWHGTIHAQSPRGSKEFGMILEIASLEGGRYSWVITYALGGEPNVRSYELVTLDAKAGRFQIDEKNGIVIDGYFAHQTLYTLFDMGGSVIDFRYAMTDEGIEVSVASSVPATATTTGGGEVPEVKNIPFAGVQFALLRSVTTGQKPTN